MTSVMQLDLAEVQELPDSEVAHVPKGGSNNLHGSF